MSFKKVNYASFPSYQTYVLRSLGLSKADYLKLKADLEMLAEAHPLEGTQFRKLSESLLKWTEYIRGANSRKAQPFHQYTFITKLADVLRTSRAVMAWLAPSNATGVVFLCEFLEVVAQLKLSADLSEEFPELFGNVKSRDAYLSLPKEDITLEFKADSVVATFDEETYPYVQIVSMYATSETDSSEPGTGSLVTDMKFSHQEAADDAAIDELNRILERFQPSKKAKAAMIRMLS